MPGVKLACLLLMSEVEVPLSATGARSRCTTFPSPCVIASATFPEGRAGEGVNGSNRPAFIQPNPGGKSELR